MLNSEKYRRRRIVTRWMWRTAKWNLAIHRVMLGLYHSLWLSGGTEDLPCLLWVLNKKYESILGKFRQFNVKDFFPYQATVKYSSTFMDLWQMWYGKGSLEQFACGTVYCISWIPTKDAQRISTEILKEHEISTETVQNS